MEMFAAKNPGKLLLLLYLLCCWAGFSEELKPAESFYKSLHDHFILDINSDFKNPVAMIGEAGSGKSTVATILSGDRLPECLTAHKDSGFSCCKIRCDKGTVFEIDDGGTSITTYPVIGYSGENTIIDFAGTLSTLPSCGEGNDCTDTYMKSILLRSMVLKGAQTVRLVLVSTHHDFEKERGKMLTHGLLDVMNFFRKPIDEIAQGVVLVLSKARDDFSEDEFHSSAFKYLLSRYEDEVTKPLLQKLGELQHVLLLRNPSEPGPLHLNPHYTDFRSRMFSLLASCAPLPTPSLSHQLPARSPLIPVLQDIVDSFIDTTVKASINDILLNDINQYFDGLMRTTVNIASKQMIAQQLQDSLNNASEASLAEVFIGVQQMTGHYISARDRERIAELNNILEFLLSALPASERTANRRGDYRTQRELIEWYKCLGLYDRIETRRNAFLETVGARDQITLYFFMREVPRGTSIRRRDVDSMLESTYSSYYGRIFTLEEIRNFHGDWSGGSGSLGLKSDDFSLDASGSGYSASLSSFELIKVMERELGIQLANLNSYYRESDDEVLAGDTSLLFMVRQRAELVKIKETVDASGTRVPVIGVVATGKPEECFLPMDSFDPRPDKAMLIGFDAHCTSDAITSTVVSPSSATDLRSVSHRRCLANYVPRVASWSKEFWYYDDNRWVNARPSAATNAESVVKPDEGILARWDNDVVAFVENVAHNEYSLGVYTNGAINDETRQSTVWTIRIQNNVLVDKYTLKAQLSARGGFLVQVRDKTTDVLRMELKARMQDLPIQDTYLIVRHGQAHIKGFDGTNVVSISLPLNEAKLFADIHADNRVELSVEHSISPPPAPVAESFNHPGCNYFDDAGCCAGCPTRAGNKECLASCGQRAREYNDCVQRYNVGLDEYRRSQQQAQENYNALKAHYDEYTKFPKLEVSYAK